MRRSRSARRSVRSAILVRPRWLSQAAVAYSFVPRNVTFKTARHRDPDASRKIDVRCVRSRMIRCGGPRSTLRLIRLPCVAAAATASHGIRDLPRPPSPLMHAWTRLRCPYRSHLPRLSPDLPRLCCIMGLRSATPPRILSHARATRNRMFHRAQLCFEQRVLAAQAE